MDNSREEIYTYFDDPDKDLIDPILDDITIDLNNGLLTDELRKMLIAQILRYEAQIRYVVASNFDIKRDEDVRFAKNIAWTMGESERATFSLIRAYTFNDLDNIRPMFHVIAFARPGGRQYDVISELSNSVSNLKIVPGYEIGSICDRIGLYPSWMKREEPQEAITYKDMVALFKPKCEGKLINLLRRYKITLISKKAQKGTDLYKWVMLETLKQIAYGRADVRSDDLRHIRIRDGKWVNKEMIIGEIDQGYNWKNLFRLKEGSDGQLCNYGTSLRPKYNVKSHIPEDTYSFEVFKEMGLVPDWMEDKRSNDLDMDDMAYTSMTLPPEEHSKLSCNDIIEDMGLNTTDDDTTDDDTTDDDSDTDVSDMDESDVSDMDDDTESSGSDSDAPRNLRYAYMAAINDLNINFGKRMPDHIRRLVTRFFARYMIIDMYGAYPPYRRINRRITCKVKKMSYRYFYAFYGTYTFDDREGERIILRIDVQTLQVYKPTGKIPLHHIAHLPKEVMRNQRVMEALDRCGLGIVTSTKPAVRK